MGKRSDENFDELLFRLNENDESLEGLTKEDFDDLIGDIKGKIDGIKYFLSKCEAESGRVDKIIKSFQDRKKAVDNSAANLKRWTFDCMEKNKMPYLEGDLFSVKMQSREGVEIFLAEPDIRLKLKFPTVVKTKYSWDSRQLAREIKADPKKFKSIAESKKSEFVVFRVKKGEK